MPDIHTHIKMSGNKKLLLDLRGCAGTFGVDNVATSEEVSPRIKKLRE